MKIDLEEYDFEIEYIKEEENRGADVLSRIKFDNIKQIHRNNFNIHQIRTRSKSLKIDRQK